jgi:hypothetical protein
MAYFNSISVQKDPFRVNVKVENLLFEFFDNIDQLIANVVKVLKFQLDLLLRKFKGRTMGFFIDYKVVFVVFKYFEDFGSEIL